MLGIIAALAAALATGTPPTHGPVAPSTLAQPARLDPYKAFRFGLRWEGREVAGLSEKAPANVQKITGMNKSTDVTLKRGVIADPGFEDWLKGVSGQSQGDPTANPVRKDVELDRYDEAGRLVAHTLLRRCWPLDLQALPDLDAGGHSLAVQSLTLRCKIRIRAPVPPAPAPAH
jgi:phage tail-like protein